jgi:hypothetical protein
MVILDQVVIVKPLRVLSVGRASDESTSTSTPGAAVCTRHSTALNLWARLGAQAGAAQRFAIDDED